MIAIGNYIGKKRNFSWATYWTTRYLTGLAVTTTSDTTQTIAVTIVGTGADGVSWEYREGGVGAWTVAGTSVLGSYSATGLAANTLYEWRARLYKGIHYSAYSNVQLDVTWPTSLSTNHFDYDFEIGITKSGNDVSQWDERIGAIQNLIKINTNFPQYGVSGIIFNNSKLQKAFILVQPTFVYLVCKQITWISTRYLFDGKTDSSGSLLQYDLAPELDAYAGTHSAHEPNLIINHWGIVRVLFNGANSKLIVNGNTPITFDSGAGHMDGLTLGGSASGTQGAYCQMKRFISANIDDAANEAGIYNYLLSKYFNTCLVCDGDSLTAGIGSGATDGMTYPKQLEDLFMVNDNRCVLVSHSFAVAGQTLTQMEADAATQIDPLYNATHKTLLIWGGVNDFGLKPATTKETIFTRLQTYVTARKAVGWKTIVFTMLPQSYYGRVGFDAERLWFNTQIKTALTGVDIIVDVAADSRIGDAGDELDATYYTADKIHLNNTGYGIVANIAYTAIKNIVLA